MRPDPDERAPDERQDRVLVLRLARGSYAIRERDVSGVARSGGLRPVPRSPRPVLGLTEWRGRLLTVLDLPALVDDAPLGSASCLVRLAPPHDRTALMVPGPVRLERMENLRDASGLVWLEPVALLERLATRGAAER